MTTIEVYLIIALISWIIFFVSAYKKTWGTLFGSFLFAVAWPTAHVINYLMWRQSSRCAWCGKENQKDETIIRAHILECEKHPMREEIRRYEAAIMKYEDALLNIDHGVVGGTTSAEQVKILMRIAHDALYKDGDA